MIVVDASAILEVLLRRPNALKVEERIFAQGETLHAPHLLDVEVAQVLRRYTLRKEITAERGETSLTLFGQFPIRRYPHEPFLSRVWALRDNYTAYDAAYVSLAEALRATLLTCDERLAGAPGNHAKVEVI